MAKSKFQLAMEEQIAVIPKQEKDALQNLPWLKSFLEPLMQQSIVEASIRDCTGADIVRVLGLDVSKVLVERWQWELPADAAKCIPSKWFYRSFRMLDRWNRNAEATTRTAIDLTLLDVLNSEVFKDQDGCRLQCWGEISLSATGGGMKLSGRADYFLGYGRGSHAAQQSLHTMLIAGEAKAPGAALNFWQIIAYCGIIHKLRKNCPDSPNSTVYGFLTDSYGWRFIRVDNDSTVFTSDLIARKEDVHTWLAYLIRCAERSTPPATPTSSDSDLYLSELQDFKVVVERFRTLDDKREPPEEDSESDVDDSLEAELYIRQVEEGFRQLKLAQK
jgi:hypothetical protein